MHNITIKCPHKYYLEQQQLFSGRPFNFSFTLIIPEGELIYWAILKFVIGVRNKTNPSDNASFENLSV